MKRAFPLWIVGLLTTFALASIVPSQEPTPPTRLEQGGFEQGDIEIQPRGPLHEAFAQPFDVQPVPSSPNPKAPPEPLPEDPPEQRPEAEDAQWIPGYWAWDTERQDYLWISGVYRIAPQGRIFVPGYWTETPEGWRWVAGFWAPGQQDSVPYTPEPPAPLDEGPGQPPPDDNAIYIPGTWVYRETRFLWQPGYYAPVREGRLWIPAHYVWTPNGHLFVNGYWDYPLEERGVVFAPAYFSQPLWRTPGWRYRPSFVVSIGAFFDSCFVRVGSPHYYFGNFYGPRYARLGYNPWFQGRSRFDPVFSYHGWRNYRNDPNWIAGAQRTYNGRTAGTMAAPPVTLAQQNRNIAGNAKAPRVVAPLNQVATVSNVRLTQTSQTQIQIERNRVQQTREAASTRSRLDSASKGGNRGEARKLDLSSVAPARSTFQGKEGRSQPSTSGPTIINGSTSPGPKLNPSENRSENRNAPPVGGGPKDNPKKGDQTSPRTITNPPTVPVTPPSTGGLKGINKKGNDNPQLPRIINNPPANNPAPAPKNNPAPRIINNPPPVNNNLPAPAPKNNPAPRIINNPPPVNNPAPAPKNNPAPRIINNPPVNNPAPAPKNNPAPRIINNPPPANVQPRANPPKAEIRNSPPPQAQPRINNPAPQRNSPPPQRNSPPPQRPQASSPPPSVRSQPPSRPSPPPAKGGGGSPNRGKR